MLRVAHNKKKEGGREGRKEKKKGEGKRKRGKRKCVARQQEVSFDPKNGLG
jgi:hypothetical protein